MSVVIEPCSLLASSAAIAAGIEPAPLEPASRLSIFHGYMPVLIVAFLVTLFATPVMRRLAVANGIIDRPTTERKIHRQPIAYLGGLAVFLGLIAGILYSYLGARFPSLMDFHPISSKANLNEDGIPNGVPLSILLGMTVIMIIGLIDDVSGISPRVKIGGQLLAAAALAVERVGVNLAEGILHPIAQLFGLKSLSFSIPFGFTLPLLGIDHVDFNVVYWVGTAIIAISVIGLCNASNLIDGLDGLLTGVGAISAAGLLIIALGMALADDGPRDGQRVILCLALLGACMGFLPHNFNPATIFLGDAGSLLIGFTVCVIVMTLGDTGKSFLVAAGLIIYAVPLIDTSLAIVRRKMSGKAISAADDQHLHHMLKRSVGVKGAVLSMYAMGIAFAVLGVGVTFIRARAIYFIAIVLAAYIGVTAIKIARRKHIEEQAAAFDARVAAGLAPASGSPEHPPASAPPEHASSKQSVA